LCPTKPLLLRLAHQRFQLTAHLRFTSLPRLVRWCIDYQVESSMEVKLSVNTVNQILGYLGTRPYQEVFQIIEAIQKEAKDNQTEAVSE